MNKIVDEKNCGDEQTNERYTVISDCVYHYRKHRYYPWSFDLNGRYRRIEKLIYEVISPGYRICW